MNHGAALRKPSEDPEFASHIMHDYRHTKFDSQTFGILEFAEKRTLSPGSMKETDVPGLRDLGLIDEQILSVVLVVYKFKLLTGIANGLGEELSKGFQSVVDRWIVGPAKDQQRLMDPV